MIGEVTCRPLLEVEAEIIPEFVIGCRVILSLFSEELQEPFGENLLEFCYQGGILQGLARDVEGQVLTVHHPFYKAQPFRQDILTVLFNEHLLAIEVDPGFTAAKAQPLDILFRHEQQGIDCQGRIS